ncbi:MAG: response regulator transcription factor [Chloroflexota bacterium]
MGKDDNIKVLLADDHQIVRQGLRMILEMEDGIEVIGEASNGEEAVQMVADNLPDVVLMDIRMSGLNGVQATEKIAQNTPSAKVIILTNYDDEELVFETTKAGAVGYLLKDVPPGRLTGAIKAAAEGYYLISPGVGRRMMETLTRTSETQVADASLTTSLTPREKEVLDLIVRGCGNREIAEKLFIAEKTVKTHISNILSKLHATNRAQAIAYVMKESIKKE